MHQSIPEVPIPPLANPRALAFFLKIGRIPRSGDEKRGQMPRPRDRRSTAVKRLSMREKLRGDRIVRSEKPCMLL